MAGQITWQSIQSNNNSDLINGAMRNLGVFVNEGFDGIKKGIEGFNQLKKEEEENQSQQILNQYLDKLAGTKTQQELDALQAAGIGDWRKQLNPKHFNQTIGAEDARTKAIADNMIREAGNRETLAKLEDKANLRANREVTNTFWSLLSNGDFNGAYALLGQHNLGDEAPFYSAIDKGRQTTAQEARTQEQHASNMVTSALNRDINQVKLKQVNAAEQERQQNEGYRQQVMSIVEPAAKSYLEQRAKDKQVVKDYASQLGLPIGSSGNIDFSAMGEKGQGMMELLDKKLVAETGKTYRQINYADDAEPLERAKEAALKAGVPLEYWVKNSGYYREMFNSANPEDFGNKKQKGNAVLQAADAVTKQFVIKNPHAFVHTPEEAVNIFELRFKQLLPRANEDSFSHALARIKGALQYGVPVKDPVTGKTENFIPSIPILEEALIAVENSRFLYLTDKWVADDLINNAIPNAIKKALESENSPYRDALRNRELTLDYRSRHSPEEWSKSTPTTVLTQAKKAK